VRTRVAVAPSLLAQAERARERAKARLERVFDRARGPVLGCVDRVAELVLVFVVAATAAVVLLLLLVLVFFFLACTFEEGGSRLW
jgi:hypothetical protein